MLEIDGKLIFGNYVEQLGVQKFDTVDICCINACTFGCPSIKGFFFDFHSCGFGYKSQKVFQGLRAFTSISRYGRAVEAVKCDCGEQRFVTAFTTRMVLTEKIQFNDLYRHI